MDFIDGIIKMIFNNRNELSIKKGRINIGVVSFIIGKDLCVIVSGGDKPHIGCVTLSIPSISLQDSRKISSTTSILNLVGHKDEEVARYISSKISSKLNVNVVTVCGIHVNNIQAKEIDLIIKTADEISERILKIYGK